MTPKKKTVAGGYIKHEIDMATIESFSLPSLYFSNATNPSNADQE
jgi:hypothetical protein